MKPTLRQRVGDTLFGIQCGAFFVMVVVDTLRTEAAARHLGLDPATGPHAVDELTTRVSDLEEECSRHVEALARVTRERDEARSLLRASDERENDLAQELLDARRERVEREERERDLRARIEELELAQHFPSGNARCRCLPVSPEDVADEPSDSKRRTIIPPAGEELAS